MLPKIVDAVGDKIEVHVDGGIRSGQDVLKAVALGAKGTFIGRPFLYGLGAMGKEGVTRALEIIRSELDISHGPLRQAGYQDGEPGDSGRGLTQPPPVAKALAHSERPARAAQCCHQLDDRKLPAGDVGSHAFHLFQNCIRGEGVACLDLVIMGQIIIVGWAADTAGIDDQAPVTKANRTRDMAMAA